MHENNSAPATTQRPEFEPWSGSDNDSESGDIPEAYSEVNVNPVPISQSTVMIL
jgi:hypothetical protein